MTRLMKKAQKRHPLSLRDLPELPALLQRARDREACRLEWQFSNNPWFKDKERKYADVGRNFWREFAASYIPPEKEQGVS